LGKASLQEKGLEKKRGRLSQGGTESTFQQAGGKKSEKVRAFPRGGGDSKEKSLMQHLQQKSIRGEKI